MQKEFQTKLNHWRISLSILIVLFVIVYFSVLVFLIGSVVQMENLSFVLFMCFFLVVLLFSTAVIRKTLFKINWIKASENGIQIYYPFLFYSIQFKWGDLKGYSKSDYYYGWKPSFKSQSLIFYTKENKVLEIIKTYNKDFISFQSKLRKMNIICFGKEPFKIRTHKYIFAKRVYKFEGMF